MRPVGLPALPRFDISRGANNCGTAGRAGRSGAGVLPTMDIGPSYHAGASCCARAALSSASAQESTDAAAADSDEQSRFEEIVSVRAFAPLRELFRHELCVSVYAIHERSCPFHQSIRLIVRYQYRSCRNSFSPARPHRPHTFCHLHQQPA